MKIKDIIALANQAPGAFDEAEVSRYFTGINLGHWPSEYSRITLTMDDGPIHVNIKPNSVTIEGQNVTPAGKIWILNQFFKSYPPIPVDYVGLLSARKGKPADKDIFIQEMRSRLNGRCNMVRLGKRRIAFAEHEIRNSDQSSMYCYETTDLDADGSERFMFIIPSAKPLIMVYYVTGNTVSRFKVNYQGQQIESLDGWERAAMSAEWPAELFSSEPVTDVMLSSLFKVFKLENNHENTIQQ